MLQNYKLQCYKLEIKMLQNYTCIPKDSDINNDFKEIINEQEWRHTLKS